MQWSDLDEASSQLCVRRSLYQGAVTKPKTAHSERLVDLPPSIVTMLTTYRKSYPELDGGFIFRQASGSAIDPDTWFKKSFVPAAVRAKLRPETVNLDDDEQLVGLHTLRHTYASLLINQGESIKYVSKQLGHASIQITADLYGHLFKETSVSAMNRLSMRIPVAAICEGASAVA